MRFSQYFRTGQKIFLHCADPELAAGRTETITVFLHDQGPGHFMLQLRYGTEEEESYPFSQGMPFDIHTDAYGVGIHLTGRFHSHVGKNLIRLDLNDDLEIFQRRTCRRIDTVIGLRYTKGRGTLRTYRTQWEKNIQLLQQDFDPDRIPPFPRVPVNLSATGVRFLVKMPVEMADLCLLLLQLDPAAKPICALTEVVWVADEETDGRKRAGLRFLNILEADQKQIEKLIKDQPAPPPLKP